MTEDNKIQSVPVEVRVHTVLSTDTATFEERQQEHAAIFNALAKLQTITDPEEFVALFTQSPAFSNTNLCTQITVKGERFNSAPMQIMGPAGVRFTTTFDLLMPSADFDEELLKKLREKTVPAGWVIVNEPLWFVVQKQFSPVEDVEEESVSFRMFIRDTGFGLEVMVAGESSNYMRHLVGRINVQQVSADERNVFFSPDVEGLKVIYAQDPYVALAVRYLNSHRPTLEWLIGSVQKDKQA